ncbi:MAG: hypothetical protein N2738_01740, partial [Thermodesulfovibrionales bacterium]|nr:hypothetical protein [Thermodesulfovibrionales bacterium]
MLLSKLLSSKEYLFRIESLIYDFANRVPFVSNFVKKSHSLKLVVFLSITLLAFISFNTAYFITSSMYHHHLKKTAIKISGTISTNITASLPFIMQIEDKKTALTSFIDSLNSSNSTLPFKVSIYRTKITEQLYGAKNNTPEIPQIKETIERSSSTTMFLNDYTLKNFYPILAQRECLSCHSNAIVGDVLAVAEIEFGLYPLIKVAEGIIAWIFFVLLPVPLLMIGLVCAFLSAKLT